MVLVILDFYTLALKLHFPLFSVPKCCNFRFVYFVRFFIFKLIRECFEVDNRVIDVPVIIFCMFLDENKLKFGFWGSSNLDRALTDNVSVVLNKKLSRLYNTLFKEKKRVGLPF